MQIAIASALTFACSSSTQALRTTPAHATMAEHEASEESRVPQPEATSLLEPERVVRVTTPLFDDSVSLTVTKTTWVLATPHAEAERLGLIGGKTRVIEKAHIENEDCPTPWIEIEPQGWVCVAVKPSNRPPSSAEPSRAMRNLPGTYAIATKATRFYKSVASAQEELRGRAAKGDMVKRRETVALDDGRVLWRTDRGEYVDASTLKRLSGSRFHGVDLTDEHGPMLPFGFAVDAGNPKKSVVVRNQPSRHGRVVQRLSRRSVVEILSHSEDGDFVEIDRDRWVQREDLRIVEHRRRPDDVQEGARWIDVDLDQQLVVAYEGSEAVFATLASTGKGENATPTGAFHITRKKRQTTMRSDRAKKQSYSVAVPWPVYFNQGFAFHSTYWHNHFGSPRSHGCVNLSPADAATIYRFVGPEMPAGWTVVYGHESQPGTAVLVRSAKGDSDSDSDDAETRLAAQ
jgi:lipoprotein-anchoring transpeptidase ErfK/SrfK